VHWCLFLLCRFRKEEVVVVERKELVAVLELRRFTEYVGTATEADGTADFAQATWRKSSYSSCNDNCVENPELRGRPVGLGDADSDGLGPVLVFGPTTWRSFIDAVEEWRWAIARVIG
jgi:Domain of unknown function (DUF397)